MKKTFSLSQLCFAAALFLAALPCPAENAAMIPRQQGNRFLFIVNTSHAMRGYANAIVQNVANLLASDMRGEFRPGDTIGLWLYNDKLDPGYPMQVWSPAAKDTIVSDMAAFLQERTYENQAHLERVLPALNRVIKTSERITVVLISDGSGSIQGTPFDKDIRALQKKYAHELRSAGVPFITVLAAHNGAVFDYTINYPGSIAIPHTANPENPVETNAPVAPVTAIVIPPVVSAPAQPRRGASIIMSRATNVVHAAAPPPPLAVVPVPAPPPVASAAPAPAPASQPTIAAAAPPAAPVVPASQPAMVAAAPPPPEVAPPQAQPVSSPASMTANDQPPPPAPAVTPNPPVATAGPAGGAPLALFVTAFLLLTIAVVLVVFLVRRSRGAPQPSLISQSIDRPR